MSMEEILFNISIFVPPLLFAITLHEAAHGYVARYFGDNTAAMLGRVSLNPAKHIDPIGTIIFPGLLFMMSSPFLLGWAKPVPIGVRNLHNPKHDMIWVALAGPAANLVMAVLWVLILKILLTVGIDSVVLIKMAFVGVSINVLLMIFNMLPIPPLDGGRVLTGLLPTRYAIMLNKVEPYGILIVLALLLMSGLGEFIGQGVSTVSILLFELFNVQ